MSRNLDLVFSIERLRKSIQWSSRTLGVFFLCTFLYFSVTRILKDGFFWSIVIERGIFLGVALVLAAWISKRIESRFDLFLSDAREREKELRFRESATVSLLSHLNEGVLEFDLSEQRWTTVSKPFCSMLGIPPSQFYELANPQDPLQPWLAHFLEADRSMIQAILARRMTHEGMDRFEAFMKPNTGDSKLVEITLTHILRNDGTANSGILIIHHVDVTQKRAAERQQQLLLSVLEHTPDAYWVVNDQGSTLYCSPAAEHLREIASQTQDSELGFLHDTRLLCDQILLEIPPGDEFKKIIQPHFNHQSEKSDFYLISAYEVETARSSAANGQLEHRYVITLKNISDAYQREAELKDLKERMDLALNAARIGVWEWDSTVNTWKWDAHLYDLFELNPGNPPSESFLDSKLMPEDLPEWRQALTRAKSSGLLESFDFRIQTLHSGVRHIRAIGQIADPSRPQQLFGVFWDVTIEKTALEALSKAQLQQQNNARLAALGEMASGVAHEINNPLAIINARALLMKRKVQTPLSPQDLQQLAESCETIEKNAVRISKIVKGLRTFSRDGEKDPYALTSVQSLIDDTIGICGERIKSHGVELKVINECPSDHQVEVRSVQIAQVLINLLNNAFDATELLAERKIEVRAFTADGKTQITVQDNGKGVPSELESKIMQPFFTTKDVGKGTGLGLSVSIGILQDHQGSLILDRSVSASCFRITIPNRQKQSVAA